ncbi:MAG: DNA polymerase III subunit delta [Mogibacterium sp.]|nr:DNA polymerase III subunit delta [Mogibacterium sp.]
MAKQEKSYKDFYTDFNRGISGSVLFFYGDEDYLMRWAADLVIDSCTDESTRPFCLTELDGAECTLEQIIATARTISMFGGKRVILVWDFKPLYAAPDRAAQKFIEDKLLDLAAVRSDDYVILFTLEHVYKARMTALAKKLSAVRQTGYEFPRLSRGELRQFIRKRVREGGRLINDRALEYMIDLSGYYLRDSEYTLTELNKDTAKLIHASDDEITRDLIEDVMIGEGEKYAFALIDAVMEADRPRAMTIVQNILASDDNAAMRILSLLAGQYEMMYDALQLDRQRMSVREMAAALGVNEYRFNRAYGAARRMDLPKIKELLMELYDIDKRIKTGDMDKDVALELFVLQ